MVGHRSFNIFQISFCRVILLLSCCVFTEGCIFLDPVSGGAGTFIQGHNNALDETAQARVREYLLSEGWEIKENTPRGKTRVEAIKLFRGNVNIRMIIYYSSDDVEIKTEYKATPSLLNCTSSRSLSSYLGRVNTRILECLEQSYNVQ